MVSQIDFTTSLCAVGLVETAYRRAAHYVQNRYRESGSARQAWGTATNNQHPPQACHMGAYAPKKPAPVRAQPPAAVPFSGLFSCSFFRFHRSPLGGVPFSGCG